MLKTDKPARAIDAPARGREPEESLVPDARAGLSPSQFVERKLWELLGAARDRSVAGRRGAP
jgi:hypothetical protein